MKSLFSILMAMVLISCGGGGGREGTCFGSAQICGDAGANSNAAAGRGTSSSQSIGAAGTFSVEYVISGTTSEASLLVFENGQDLVEQRLNVKLPFTLFFNRDSGDFLAVSAQNNFSAGNIRVAIKVNGVEQRTDLSTSPFGTAFAFMTCCR